jgi:hypothetical protein
MRARAKGVTPPRRFRRPFLAIFDAPTILPLAFLTGETVNETTINAVLDDGVYFGYL